MNIPANVNFPKNLDISPSIYSDDEGARSTAQLDTVFGFSAQRDAIKTYGIAGRIWEATYVLIQYIQPSPYIAFDPPFIQAFSAQSPLTFLELGSGAGMVSSCIANILNPLEDILIATDLPEVCPLLEQNLKACALSVGSTQNPIEDFIFVRPLTWGNESHGAMIASELLSSSNVPRTLSHVICSDLIYFPGLLAPLLRTLIQVTNPPFSRPPTPDDSGVSVIIAYRLRSFSKETPFWSAFGLWFKFGPVLVNNTAVQGGWQRYGVSSDHKTFVFTARRRPESFFWTVPLVDEDLLAGKGAMGNESVKTDDTFESLLFMTLDTFDA